MWGQIGAEKCLESILTPSLAMATESCSPQPPFLHETTIGSMDSLASTLAAQASSLTSSADALEALSALVLANCQRGVTDITTGVREAATLLSQAREEFATTVTRARRHHSAWFDKHCDELDAVDKILSAAARLSLANNSELEDTFTSLSILAHLSGCDTFPRYSIMLHISSDVMAGPVGALLDSRVQSSHSPSHTSLDGTRVCIPTHSNHISLCCMDDVRDVVRGLREDDFTIAFFGVPGAVVVKQWMDGPTFHFNYTIELATCTRVKELRMMVHLFELEPPLFDVTIPVSALSHLP